MFDDDPGTAGAAPGTGPADTAPADRPVHATPDVPSAGAPADRREFLRRCALLGLSGATLAGAVSAAAQQGAAGPAPVPDDLLQAGARLAGMEFTPAERELMAQSVADNLASIRNVQQVRLGNEVAPALVFTPLVPGVVNLGRPRDEVRGPYDLPGPAAATDRPTSTPSSTPPARRPTSPAELAFLPVTVLSGLVRTGEVRSRELTEIYLDRIRRHNPQLLAVITPTEELARGQADRADAEIRAGRYRGPLHGIPYGVKDLLATRGIATTWGAEPYRGQVPREDATVVARLETAGAVLVGKTAVGALAWGDVWFGGTTKNPWKPDQGSSGSSAGSASGAAAGLFGFAIGTETLGSIVSPSTRCGTSGLRPTFGRVPRTGAMALSWSMDKIGPIARSVGDLALVFEAIHGADGRDTAVHDAPFDWSKAPDWRSLRVGYDRAAFDMERDEKGFDDAVLDTLRRMGVTLVPVSLPDLVVTDQLFILECEAAAAFDELTRSNQDDQLARQVAQAWPNIFRAARLVTAVDYIQASRVRTLLMQQFDRALAGVDAWVSPAFYGVTLRATNLTGHPTVVLPSGFRADGTPTSITFSGRLFGEESLLALARAYQEETGWHRRRPPGLG